MKLFICHSSADKPVIRRVTRRLRPFLVDTWIDEKELAPGDSLHTAIGGALESADALLACVSRDSLDSRWVQKELSVLFAREDCTDRPLVVPLLLDDAQPTGFLRDRLQARLRNGESNALAAILRGIWRSRDIVLLKLNSEEPFSVSAESIDQAVGLRDQRDPDASPLFVVDADGFFASLEWYLRQGSLCLRERGHEIQAESWRHYLDWNDGVADNLSVAAEGIFCECRSRRPNAMELKPALDRAWKALLRLVLLDMPAFMPGYSDVALPADHDAWHRWFSWADARLTTVGGGQLAPVIAALLAKDLGQLAAVDLVCDNEGRPGAGPVWCTHKRVSSPCVGMFPPFPVTELQSVWLDEVVPQLAARLVFDATHAGHIVQRDEFDKLRMEHYRWVGPH